MKSFLLSTILLSTITGCAGHKKFKQPMKLYKAIHSESRSKDNIVRDVYRHPMETLMFFDVKPHHTVVEIGPGSGWYTEILGPYLKDEGALYLTTFSPKSTRSYAPKLTKLLKDKVSNEEFYQNIKFSVFEPGVETEDIAPAGTADRVLTFRNIHNWMKEGKLEESLANFYRALKPGGVFGVVEHRTRSSKKQDPKAISGYVREDYVIKAAEAVGFKFAAKSEVNANYLDKADHKKGVWTLPPSLRGDETKRVEFLAIGESDRMTLKFVKP